MSGNEQQGWRALPLPLKVVALQGFAVIAASGIAWMAGGAPRALLLGGLCACLPNAWMALRVTLGNRLGGVDGHEVESAIGLVLAAVAKLLMTVALVAIVFWRLPELDGALFFVGFIIAALTHRVALLMTDVTPIIPAGPPQWQRWDEDEDDW